jgi:hypothetical protein
MFLYLSHLYPTYQIPFISTFIVRLLRHLLPKHLDNQIHLYIIVQTAGATQCDEGPDRSSGYGVLVYPWIHLCVHGCVHLPQVNCQDAKAGAMCND